MCRLTGVQPSLLLHPLDFMGKGDSAGELDFFPAMRQAADQKIEVVSEVLRLMGEQYRIVTMHEHAQSVGQRARFPLVEPRFEA
jgi:hypothetical protein